MNKNNWTRFFVVMMACLLMAWPSHADVKVTSIEVKPRFPWNGLVDIIYSVSCDEKDLNGQPFEVRVEFEGYDAVLDKKIVMKTMSGDGVGTPIMSGGPYKATWDAAKDYPTINSSKFQIKIHASVPLYMVVDLSGGPDAANYPVRYTGEAPNLDDDTCRTTELWLRRIPAGKFLMGSIETELGRSENEILHEITITQVYYIGIFECTQKQYQSIVGENPSSNKGDNRPVATLSYSCLQSNSGILNKLKNKTGIAFNLPTEAEWEYACRAGTTTALNSGKDLTIPNGNDPAMNEVGRYAGNMGDGKGGYTYGPTKVGCYLPNAWGLYDMHGNVWEWCRDWYDSDYYMVSPAENPSGPSSGSKHVARGGSYDNDACVCRSAYRDDGTTSYYNHTRGFRVICQP